jgi:2-methylisocitrate lyase-like PEP mutase family enzyme
MNNFNRFKMLHNSKQALLLNNIWDAASAAIVQKNGAAALATSSASLAWALGYADGSVLPIDELINAVKRIQKVAKIPLSVDIEDGYSNNPKTVAKLAEKLALMGVAGINIEDGEGTPELLNEKIKEIRLLVGNEFFINARTDVYLRKIASGESAFDMATKRLKSYQQSGADCVFIPGLVDGILATRLTTVLSLPVNLMVNNLQSDVAQFDGCGISRFSVGPNSFIDTYKALSSGNTEMNFATLNALFH